MKTIDRPLVAGVETLAIRADLGSQPSDSALYELHRYGAPAFVRYRHPKPDPGLSGVSVIRSPKGWSVQAEGNLTTLLYGAGSEVGSISAGEVDLGAKALVRSINRHLPGIRVPDELWRWDVTRYDPSTTLILPEEWLPLHVVHAAYKAWASIRSGKQTLSLHQSTGATTTLRVTAGHSRSVYDKSAASLTQGKPCPANAVRLESRVRPKPFPLSESGVLVSEASTEVSALAASIGQIMKSATQVNLHTLIEAQKALGEEPNVSEALTLTAVHQLLALDGSVQPLIQEGMSQATAYRRRARLQKLLAAATEEVQDRAAADVFGMSEVLLARQLMESLDI